MRDNVTEEAKAAPKQTDQGPDRETVERIVARILALPPTSARHRVAIAGPPGAGKSTLAEAVVKRLNGEVPFAALMPMDGFHLDNAVLEARGLLPRKGAPETFDSVGFVQAVRRLASEDEVVIPVFDRARDIAIAGAQVIDPGIRVVVVEGNYLLLRESPWYGLHGLWDVSVFLDPGLETLEDRLIRRWLTHGMDYADARQRARANDLPNAKRVLARRAFSTLTL